MSALRVFLFGRFRMTLGDSPSELGIPPALQLLLAYLLLGKHRTYPREKLAGLFWSDCGEDRARGRLRTALWRLRRLFESEGIPWEPYLITMPTGEVGFNQESDCWLDVTVFEKQASRILAQPIHIMGAADVQKLESTLELYTGELLEGFYDEWVLWERERLERLYLNCLAHLLCYCRHHGAYKRGLECGHRILLHDPLREEIYREMMQIYIECGQRALAVRQYETCRDVLALELNIEPMEETRALYTRLVLEDSQQQARSGDLYESTSVQQALQQICLGMRSLKNAQEQFQQAIDLIGLIKPEFGMLDEL